MNLTPEEYLRELMSVGGLDLFPADTQEEVEQVLAAGQSLEPETRAHFIDAASRGVKRLALTRSPVEVLLVQTRREKGKDADEVAHASAIDAEDLRAIERGERAIDRESPERIAAWIRFLDLSGDVAVPALRRSLGASASVSAYAAEFARERSLTDEQEEYVRRVESALSNHPPHGASGVG